MTGDHGHDTALGRPGFLPPAEGRPQQGAAGPPAEGSPAARPSRPRSRGATAWWFTAMAAACGMLVSPFLPWVKAQVELRGFGQTLTQDLATEAGVNVDGTGQVVPVFAMLAIFMIIWGLFAHNTRISALAAVPAVLTLLSCGIFIMRLSRFKEEIGIGRANLGSYEISASYGWFLTLATSLLLAGLCLAGLVSRRSRAGAAASDPAANPSPH